MDIVLWIHVSSHPVQTSQSQFHNFCLCLQTNPLSTLFVFVHIAPCACIQSVQTNQSCFSTIVVLAFSLSRTLSTLYTLCSVWATLSLSIEHSALCVLHLCELSVCVLSTNPCSTLCTCYNVDTGEVRKSPQWKSLQWVLCAQHRFSGAAQYLRFTGSEGRGCTIFAYPITCIMASCVQIHVHNIWGLLRGGLHNICLSYHLHSILHICAQLRVAQYLRILSLALWYRIYRIYTQDEISNNVHN